MCWEKRLMTLGGESFIKIEHLHKHLYKHFHKHLCTGLSQKTQPRRYDYSAISIKQLLYCPDKCPWALAAQALKFEGGQLHGELA